MTKTTFTPSELASEANALELVDQVCHAEQATVATATIYRGTVDRKGYMRTFRMGLGTCGTAGDTDVQIHKNGVQVGEEGTIDNADADGTRINVAVGATFNPGDLLEVVVTAAPTGGANLFVDAPLVRVFD